MGQDVLDGREGVPVQNVPRAAGAGSVEVALLEGGELAEGGGGCGRGCRSQGRGGFSLPSPPPGLGGAVGFRLRRRRRGGRGGGSSASSGGDGGGGGGGGGGRGGLGVGGSTSIGISGFGLRRLLLRGLRWRVADGVARRGDLSNVFGREEVRRLSE